MPKTVLIVEDDEDTRTIYGAALAERGYQVLTAIHGAEGVHIARTRCPDLLLLDIRMPVMNGWAAARYLKSYPETRSIPICAISAHELEAEEDKLVERYVDCFLLKPVDPGSVVAEVERRIGSPIADLPPLGAPPSD